MYGNGKPGAYQSTQVSTVNKQKLIILMYDGAIRFANQAVEMISKGDIAGRGVAIGKARKIIDELASALNSNKGGDVAQSLSKVYMEINRLFSEANITGKRESLDTALGILNNLKGAWEQIINGNRAKSNKAVDSGDGQKEKVAISC